MRHPARLAIIVMLIALIAHGAVWAIGAVTLTQGLDRLERAEAEAGGSLSYTGRWLGGWPFAVTLALEEITLERANGLRWSAPSLRLSSALGQPALITLSAPEPSHLGLLSGERDLAFAIDAGEALLAFDDRGHLTALDLVIRSLRLSAIDKVPPETPVAAELTVYSHEPLADSPRTRHRLTLDRLTAGADDGSSRFNRLVERLEVVVLQTGRIPAGSPADSLAQWRDSGGQFTIETLFLDWDPLTFSASGEARLDDALQPVATLNGTLRGHDETLDALAEAGFLTARQVQAAKVVLALVARPDPETGQPVLEVPIIIARGRVSLAGIDLAEIPQITWQ